MLDFRPTLFFGVPTIYVRLLETPPAVAREIGAEMRLFVSGSAPLPAQVLEDFRDAVRSHHPRALRHERDAHEPEQSVCRRAARGDRRVPVARRVGPSARSGWPRRVRTARPASFTCAVRTFLPATGAGDEATRAAFVDGWFRTGDLAVRSPDGYYTLVGRRSDLIISGGFNIYPREIEEFLTEQPEIAEAAVVGVADRVRGEVPVAYVVARAALSRRNWRPAAARRWPRLRCRERSSPSRNCRAMPWGRSRSICCRAATIKQQ